MSQRKKYRASAMLLCLILGLLFCMPGGSVGSAQQEALFFTLLHTNDEHGAFIPHSPAVDAHPDYNNPTIGGYARLASRISNIRREKAATQEPVVLVSAGDFIGGSAFSWLVPEGIPAEITIKQVLGYDAVTIGNHEYDYGTEVLTRYLQAAGYPAAHERTAVLASNTAVPKDHPAAVEGLFQNGRLLTLDNGLVLGFFGLIGQGAISVTGDAEPFHFTDQATAARQAVADLKAAGADVIIALSHSGVSEDEALAAAVPGIHLIVGGHSHTALHEPLWVEDTLIVQAGAYLSHLGRLDLAYTPEGGRLRLRNLEIGQPYLLPLDSSVVPDPDMTAMIETYTLMLNELVSRLTQGRFEDVLGIVAESDFPIVNTPPHAESPLGNFITDAMRHTAWTHTGRRVDVALQANGSIRGSLLPGTMPHSKGLISFYDITALISLGYGADGNAGYPLVSFYLTGEELRRALEVAVLLPVLLGDQYFLQFSGLRYDYNPRDAVLFTLPFLDLPLPSTRAVKRAELYTGDGIQSVGDTDYMPLKRGDGQLYHVVTDSYILSFLPMAGELLPQLTIEPKDRNGNPVSLENFDQFILRDNGSEVKVWQAVVQYAADQTIGERGLSQIPDYYQAQSGRIRPVSGIPLVFWLAVLCLMLLFILYIIIRQVRRRIAQRRSSRFTV